MARAMLDEASVSNTFWGEETQTSVYLSNRVILRPNNEKNPYELWKGRPTKIYHLKIFGRRCYIKRTKEKIVKFKPRVNEGILLGYSFKRKGYKCYNLPKSELLPKYFSYHQSYNPISIKN